MQKQKGPGTLPTSRPDFVGGAVVPLVPFENVIPDIAKDFYRHLDKEYIKRY